ncbi:MAG TPA: MBL fold metallo-hydrolase [Chthoniobacter sp.]|jgi:ribonuclease BN (tRNA processing enzyme)
MRDLSFIRFGLAALALFLSATCTAQSRTPSARLEVVALGTGGPAATGRASSGFMVLLDGTPRVVVDAGGGTFARVSELRLSLDNVDLILLTHLHIDHCADVPAIVKARGIVHNGPYTFRIFGPEGAGPYPALSQWVKLLFGKDGAFAYQPDFNDHETFLPTDLTRDLAKPPAMIYEEGPLQIQAVATHHGDCPSVAYRLDYAGASVTFSGDLDASALPNLARLAAGTDLLIVNAVVLDPPDSPEILYQLHSPPKAIGETARDTKVKRVLLSHIGPAIERNWKAVKASIARSYPGPVEMAEDKSRYPVSH